MINNVHVSLDRLVFKCRSCHGFCERKVKISSHLQHLKAMILTKITLQGY